MRVVFISFALAAGLLACGEQDMGKVKDDGKKPSPQGDDGADPEPSASPTPTATPSVSPTPASEAEPCVAPAGAVDDPTTIEQAIQLINALPKPVTVKCYLESLRRPLHVNATLSTLSVQPAVGSQDPRLFLLSGSLVTAIAVSGDGAKLLEFSLLKSDTASVKGELAMPVTDSLAADAAYAHVLMADGTGTRCSACHTAESAAPDVAANAFVSKAFRPAAGSALDLTSLDAMATACEATPAPRTGRCQILRALFAHGAVEAQAFPSAMPTMFGGP